MKPRTVPLHTCSWPSLPQRSGKTSKQNKLHGENVLPYLSKCVPKLKELHTWINNCVAHIYTRRKSACWISILLVKSSLTKPRTVPLHTCTWPPLPQRSGKTSKQNKLMVKMCFLTFQNAFPNSKSSMPELITVLLIFIRVVKQHAEFQSSWSIINFLLTCLVKRGPVGLELPFRF